jgi:hypothetical protein
MAVRSTLHQLRDAIRGNGRGREVEVKPTGELILDPDQKSEGQNTEQNSEPKPAKMDKHTFGF